MLLSRNPNVATALLASLRQIILVYTYSLLPYLLVISLCILANIIYFQSLIKTQEERDQYVLKTYMREIGYIITNDFNNAVRHNDNFKFLFFKFYDKPLSSNFDNKPLYFNNDNFYILDSNGTFVLNQNSLADFLTDTLPSYIDYQILFNEVAISNSHNPQKNLDIETKHNIDAGHSIIIKLGINKIHPNYLSMVRTQYYKVLISIISSLILAVTSLHFYLNQRKKFINKITRLEANLVNTNNQLENTKSDLRHTITALMEEKKYEHQLRRMFIRHATNIYLDNNIPNAVTDKKHMNELSNFLFPLVFTEPVNTEEIEIDQVIKDLTGYLAYDATKYDIKFDKQADILKVRCSEAVFYQILFSLVSNLILLMPKVPDDGLQAEPKKKFTVTFLEEKIIIDFETFPLNAQQIASFTDKKMPVDAFFLDYKRVLESMKIHNISYSVTPGKTSNLYKLVFKKKIPKGKPELRLVE